MSFTNHIVPDKAILFANALYAFFGFFTFVVFTARPAMIFGNGPNRGNPNPPSISPHRIRALERISRDRTLFLEDDSLSIPPYRIPAFEYISRGPCALFLKEEHLPNEDDGDLGITLLPINYLGLSYSPPRSPTHTESKREQPLSPLTTTVVVAADTGTTAARTLRPSVSRSSTSALLSDGKSLKSSLKSSDSSPNIPFSLQSLAPSPQHLQRAASASTTPRLAASSAFPLTCAVTSPCALSSSTATSPVVNSHTASQEEGDLAIIPVYNRSVKAASSLHVGDEGETEGEDSSTPTGFVSSICNTGQASAYPFLKLRTAGASVAGPLSELAASTEAEAPQELIGMQNLTPLPARGTEGSVFFEGLEFLTDAGSSASSLYFLSIPLRQQEEILVRHAYL